MTNKTPRVLITGMGGAAGVSIVKAFKGVELDLYLADMDHLAAGIYQTSPDKRLIIPRGDSPEFADHILGLCERYAIDVLIPTVDVELISLARMRDRFMANGTRLLLAPESALVACLDKWRLTEVSEGIIPTPFARVIDETFDASDYDLPVIVKPRSGSGGRGIRLVESVEELQGMPRDGHLMVQEYLPGMEYSVDTLVSREGQFIAAVPRERLKVDSGIAVTARTVRDERLQNYAARIAAHLGITYTSNIQFRCTASGEPRLMEINPRFPGTMPLTVAAGVNMPLLSLQSCMGESISHVGPEFEEIAVVRSWGEQVLRVDELEQMSQKELAIRDHKSQAHKAA